MPIYGPDGRELDVRVERTVSFGLFSVTKNRRVRWLPRWIAWRWVPTSESDRPLKPAKLGCRVYWGSHGCHKRRGHVGRRHRCDCTPRWFRFVPRRFRGGHVGVYPYYGEHTNFYGEDSGNLCMCGEPAFHMPEAQAVLRQMDAALADEDTLTPRENT